MPSFLLCEKVIDEQNDIIVGGLLKNNNIFNLYFFFCAFQSGANQQFGEPGVWPGHVKERRRRCWRWSRRQRRRGGPLPRLKPRQSITGETGAPKARHRGGVPGTPVLQPHTQGRCCVLRGAPRHHRPVPCALCPRPSLKPPLFVFFFYIKQDHYQSLLRHPIFKIDCF